MKFPLPMRLPPTQILCTLICLATLTISCGGQNQARSLRGAEYFYQEGIESLERKRFLDAIESFQRVVSNFPGSSLICDAQYHLAEAYFRMDDFVNAVFEYQRLADAYPTCSWADRAQFQVGESHFLQMRRAELDQTETHEAIRHFRRFIDDNPDSPLVEEARARVQACRARIAEKQYKAGELYHKQGHLEAARITYELLLREFPETPQYCAGMKQLGDVERRDGNPEKARFYWEMVASECSDEDILKDVHIWLTELLSEE